MSIEIYLLSYKQLKFALRSETKIKVRSLYLCHIGISYYRYSVLFNPNLNWLNLINKSLIDILYIKFYFHFDL